VLTRILVGPHILDNATIQGILADSEHYVREFQYSLAPSPVKHNHHARLLRVVFNEKLLVDTLRPGQLQFWNEIRTRTLLWLVIEEHGKRQFFDARFMPEIDAAIIKAAKHKALPILYPMRDLKEQRILSISDVLSAYPAHLLAVSLRYDVVSTLAGKLSKKDQCWTAEWTLYFDHKITQWYSPCGLIDAITLHGFQGVYDYLSTYYAVKPNTQTLASTIIKITNINSIPALERVSDYLESLAIVSTANWIGQQGKYNLYRLFFLGKQGQLSHQLIKDAVLTTENTSGQNNNDVNYQLILTVH